MGYGPQGHKELDTTEVTQHAHTVGLESWCAEGMIVWLDSLSLE